MLTLLLAAGLAKGTKMPLWIWIVGGAAALWLLSKKSSAAPSGVTMTSVMPTNPATAVMSPAEQAFATLIRQAIYANPQSHCVGAGINIAVKFSNADATQGEVNLLTVDGMYSAGSSFTLVAPPGDDALTKSEAVDIAARICAG